MRSLLLSGFVLAVAGCGGETGPAKHRVHGNVSLDGVPVAEGSVLFDGLGKSANEMAPIRKGAYEARLSPGVLVQPDLEDRRR